MLEVNLRLPVYGTEGEEQDLGALVPAEALALAEADTQRAMPAVAKNAALMANIQHVVRQLPTQHRLVCGDGRDLSAIPDESVHLAVTSPPYWTLKDYLPNERQLGRVADYDEFLTQLDQVWRHVYRVLVPGGRLVVVVGDVCMPRRVLGRHVVFPLHASIQEHCRGLGFDNLSPIIWHKIANATFEAGGGSILGKPYEPGAIVKNDIKYILFQRKPDGYRQQSVPARLLSLIPEACHREWFQQIWTIPGASTRHHPAPYPLGLAERLVRMFSFVGDTVLDPFMGTATTNLAASRWGRNSIGVEVEPAYFALALARMEEEKQPRMYLREVA